MTEGSTYKEKNIALWVQKLLVDDQELNELHEELAAYPPEMQALVPYSNDGKAGFTGIIIQV
jgi:hypothetical protein